MGLLSDIKYSQKNKIEKKNLIKQGGEMVPGKPRDNVVCLHDGSFAHVDKIEGKRIIIRNFKKVAGVYDYPCNSSDIRIFQASRRHVRKIIEKKSNANLSI